MRLLQLLKLRLAVEARASISVDLITGELPLRICLMELAKPARAFLLMGVLEEELTFRPIDL